MFPDSSDVHTTDARLWERRGEERDRERERERDYREDLHAYLVCFE